MNGYILSISIFSILSTFIYISAPEKTQKYISYLASLIMIVIIISPVIKCDFSKALEDLPETEESFTTNDTNYKAAEYISKAIYQTMMEEYNIHVSKVIVTTSETSAFDVQEINVYINTTMIDSSVISEKLSELYNCKIRINQGG